MATEKLMRLLTGTFAACGARPLSPEGAEVILMYLEKYTEDQVMGALGKCARELSGRVTLAEIIDRIPDGRPGPEEAWATVPKNEDLTCVWTEETREAFAIADVLIKQGDRIGARMAFLEAYKRFVYTAREEGRPCKWVASQGWDPKGRLGPIMEALDRNLITYEDAVRELPHEVPEAVALRLEGTAPRRALPSPEDRKKLLAIMDKLHEPRELPPAPGEMRSIGEVLEDAAPRLPGPDEGELKGPPS